MLSHKNKYFLYLLSLNGILIALLAGYGKTVFEDSRSWGGIAAAMAFFFLYEWFVISFMDAKGKNSSSRQSVNLFLAFKAGKIVLSLFFIAIYLITVNVEVKRFIGVFLVLYFIYLLFDTIYLISRERSLKSKEYKEKI